MVKMGHYALTIAFAKCSVSVENSNSKKLTKNDSTGILEIFFANNRTKNQLTFKRQDHFKNGQIDTLCISYTIITCSFLNIN